jgi:acylglycerol lipase
MGHSMGGGEVLCYAAQGPSDVRQHIRGYLLESPFVDFNAKSKPSFLTIFAGRMAGKLLPHRQLTNKLDPKLVSRDPAVCDSFDKDELCHDTGTLEGLAGMLDRTVQLAGGKVNIPDDAGEGGVTRIWIAHGDADGITDYNATKRLADALQVKDKEFKSYAGYFHRCKQVRRSGCSQLTLAVHDEPSPDKEVFMEDVANWILARSTEPVQVGDGTKPKL